MNNYFELFREQLKKHGLKYTTQRRAILDVLIEHKAQSFCCEEIYDMVKVKYPEVGLATVYRTMLLLEKFELVYKVDSKDSRLRYCIADNSEDRAEPHIICIKCGKTAELRKSMLAIFEKQLLKYHGFQVKNKKVKLYGYCKKCLRKKNKN